MTPPQQDNPRLLARKSQHGYIEINPNDPLRNMHHAMYAEPEPVPPEYQQHLTNTSRQQHAAANASQLVAQRGRSIGIQVKEAARRGDTKAFADLGAQLTHLAQAATAT